MISLQYRARLDGPASSPGPTSSPARAESLKLLSNAAPNDQGVKLKAMQKVPGGKAAFESEEPKKYSFAEGGPWAPPLFFGTLWFRGDGQSPSLRQHQRQTKSRLERCRALPCRAGPV